MQNRLAIGGNNPPTEAEILKQRLDQYTVEEDTFKLLEKRVLPAAIADDVQAGQVSDFIQASKILMSKIAEIHKKEKKPFWDAGKQADEWKNAYEDKIGALLRKAEPIMIAWNREKARIERERQLEISRKAREEAEALAAEAAAHEAEGINDTAQELVEAAVQEEQKADMILHSALEVKGVSRGGFSSSTNKKVWVGKIEAIAAIDLEALRKYFSEEEIQSALNRAIRDGVRNLRGAHIYEEEKLSTLGRR